MKQQTEGATVSVDSEHTASITIAALGQVVRVDAPAPEEELRRAWSRCLTDQPPTSTLTLDAPDLSSITQAITRHLLAGQVGSRLLLHAGAVAHPDNGATLVFAAPGGTGKTTLVRRLAQRYGYVTDESVAVSTQSLSIDPYEKPLSTRMPSSLTKTEVSPDELGLQPSPARPHLAGICLLRRDPMQQGLSIQELDLFDGIISLVPETSSLCKLQQPLHLLAKLHGQFGSFTRLSYGEAASLDEWVDQRMEALC